jgi:predicted nucleic acid-binding protein
MVIISDTGPLIALAKSGNLNILEQLFKKVKIPPGVFEELKISSPRPGAIKLREAIKITKWIKISKPGRIPDTLMNPLDRGEAEAIVLAKKEGLVLLIDERRGRRFVKKEGVKITGTGAVLAAAKQKGIIEKVSYILNELMESGYRISSPLREKILNMAGEGDKP